MHLTHLDMLVIFVNLRLPFDMRRTCIYIPQHSPSGTKGRVHVKSPVRSRSPIQARSPVRVRSLKRVTSPRSPSRSPSPRSKQMRQTQEGREFDRVKDREYDRRSNEDHDRSRHRDKDKGSSRDGTRETRGQDKYLDPSSMLQHSWSISPNDHRQRRKHGSQSPPRRSSEHGPDKPKTANAGAYDEVSGINTPFCAFSKTKQCSQIRTIGVCLFFIQKITLSKFLGVFCLYFNDSIVKTKG